MALAQKDVEGVAFLARLALDEEEIATYTKQLNSILGYMEKINSLDTVGVEPTAHVLPLKNVFRGDVNEPGLSQDEALANAPDQERGQFRVPRII
ncbi:MAG: Asp-tRNA(Asn)/Glu-tRNA(Gln) amidotransferase subunit GatC [Syntrophomonadaceae bacterium]|nr:Asp-tRNA(Asn)/Glu-tRNA(Gln) amidotransferase subunit GatC [Syntrophomonadaceae bacterium]